MEIKNTEKRFGIVSILFHWTIAALMIGLIIVGLYMEPLPINALKLKLYGLHKEFGILVMFLAILRMLWLIINRSPTYPSHMPRWQQHAARAVHILFYGLMFALPLTGWMISSAAGLPVSFFGLFVMPDLVAPSEALRLTLQGAHKWLAYGLIAALCAHIAGTIQHHFIYKDDILRRILP